MPAITVLRVDVRHCPSFNGRQDNGVGEIALSTIHTERQTEAGGSSSTDAFRPVLQ